MHAEKNKTKKVNERWKKGRYDISKVPVKAVSGGFLSTNSRIYPQNSVFYSQNP